MHLVSLSVLLFMLLLSAWPVQAQRWHHDYVEASSVDISHTGIHTHENYVKYDLSRLRIGSGWIISATPHCDYITWVPQWGSIENWITTLNGNTVYVGVPSRFADWVAGMWWWWPDRAWRYSNVSSYSLEIWWYGW